MASDKSDNFWLGFFLFMVAILVISPIYTRWTKDKLTPFEHYLKAKYNYDARD